MGIKIILNISCDGKHLLAFDYYSFFKRIVKTVLKDVTPFER